MVTRPSELTPSPSKIPSLLASVPPDSKMSLQPSPSLSKSKLSGIVSPSVSKQFVGANNCFREISSIAKSLPEKCVEKLRTSIRYCVSVFVVNCAAASDQSEGPVAVP